MDEERWNSVVWRKNLSSQALEPQIFLSLRPHPDVSLFTPLLTVRLLTSTESQLGKDSLKETSLITHSISIFDRYVQCIQHMHLFINCMHLPLFSMYIKHCKNSTLWALAYLFISSCNVSEDLPWTPGKNIYFPEHSGLTLEIHSALLHTYIHGPFSYY